VMLTTFGEYMADGVAWGAQALGGQDLVDERSGQVVALLYLIPDEDNVVASYTRRARSWVTVTRVVLPGYDDPGHLRRLAASEAPTERRKRLLERLADRTDTLLRKAMVQGGLPTALVDHAVVEWRKVGFIAGVDHADRYGVPSHLTRYPRYHVRVQF